MGKKKKNTKVPYPNTKPRGLYGLSPHRKACVDFWNEFRDGSLDKRRYPSHKGKDAVIAALVKLGEFKVVLKTNNYPPGVVRAQYNNHSKKLRGYNNFEVCFACGAPARCRHHIIWIKNGGRNTRKNICPLCYDCHAEIHPWLKKL